MAVLPLISAAHLMGALVDYMSLQLSSIAGGWRRNATLVAVLVVTVTGLCGCFHRFVMPFWSCYDLPFKYLEEASAVGALIVALCQIGLVSYVYGADTFIANVCQMTPVKEAALSNLRNVRLLELLLGDGKNAQGPQVQSENPRTSTPPCGHRRQLGNNLHKRRVRNAPVGAEHRLPCLDCDRSSLQTKGRRIGEAARRNGS